MRALLLDTKGAPDALYVGALPDPIPGPGEVRVAVEACGLNPSDFQRAHYGVPEWEWPAVLGLDVVGTIDAIGPDVSGFDVGERVACHTDIRARGGFAERAVVPAAALARVPDALSSVDAAAMPSAGLTAYQAVVRRTRVEAEDVVLITGGAGGVGGFAVQLAAHRGARVIATDAAEHEAHVRALGAETFIDYRSEDVPARVREVTGGRGVDVVIDTAGEESATANIQLLAFGGRIATTAGRPDISVVPPFSVGPSVHEIALGAAHILGDERARRDLGTMLAELLVLVAEGSIDPMTSVTVALDEVPKTLDAMTRFGVRGKAVFDATL